jgi:hypothetical protein
MGRRVRITFKCTECGTSGYVEGDEGIELARCPNTRDADKAKHRDPSKLQAEVVPAPLNISSFPYGKDKPRPAAGDVYVWQPSYGGDWHAEHAPNEGGPSLTINGPFPTEQDALAAAREWLTDKGRQAT